MKRGFLIAILALAAPGVAQAQTLRDSISRSEARDMRQEGDHVSAERIDLKTLAEQPAVTFKAALGVAYTKAEDDTKKWTTPIAIEASMNGGDTSFKLLTDGYTRVELGDQAASGISDMTLRASQTLRPFKPEYGYLIASGGVKIPVAGDVGSKSANQDIQLTYVLKDGAWQHKGTVRERHLNASAPPGVSQFASRGLVQSKYTFKEDTDVFLQLVRDQRRGAGGVSSLYAGHDFVLLPGLNAAITFVRGLTRGSRDNTIEFDISFKL